MNYNDRYYIERKYHNPEEEFDPFQRRIYHGIGYIQNSGLDDTEILDGLKNWRAKQKIFPILQPGQKP